MLFLAQDLQCEVSFRRADLETTLNVLTGKNYEAALTTALAERWEINLQAYCALENGQH